MLHLGTLESLGPDECLRLLATRNVGRLGVSLGAIPVVVPVAYCATEDSLDLAVAPDDGLARALEGTVVGFESGTLDPLRRVGWTVSATGIAHPARPSGTANRSWPWPTTWQVFGLTNLLLSGQRAPASTEDLGPP